MMWSRPFLLMAESLYEYIETLVSVAVTYDYPPHAQHDGRYPPPPQPTVDNAG